MFRRKVIGIALLVVLALSMTWFVNLPTTTADRTRAMVLPFNTSWETATGDRQGLVGSLSTVDWSNGGFSNPLLKVVSGAANPKDPGYVSPPTAGSFGYDFGYQELLATGTFGPSYSYCYFSLFDQSAACDCQLPFQLRQHTYIGIWHYNVQHADCMIDGLVYDQNNGHYQTLRDFSYQDSNGNTKYIVDQNNVRIHPACRSGDTQGQWVYSCFDLSAMWNSDPGGWWVEKIWIGFDNGNDRQTGAAATVFDLLRISYGQQSYSTTVSNPDYGQPQTNPSPYTTASIIPCCITSDASGTHYYLGVKLAITGRYFRWTNNGNIPVYPDQFSVSFPAGNDPKNPLQILTKPEPTGVNITNPDSSFPAGAVCRFVYDVAMIIVGTGLKPIGYIGDAITLAQDAFGLVPPSSPQKITYTWPECSAYPTEPMQGSTFAMGEAYLSIPVSLNGTTYTIPITFTAAYASGVSLGFTTSITINLVWSSTPDSIPNGTLSGNVVHPSAPDMTLNHVGNPSSSDCNMTVNMNAKGPLFQPPNANPTFSIEYKGSLWAPPSSPGNIVFAVIGIGDTPLSTTGGAIPGAYPGGTYDAQFTYTLPQSSGAYNVYGMVANVYNSDQAKQQYANYPWMRFLVGVIYFSSAAIAGPIHGPTFPVSVNINPPPCYLLSPQAASPNHEQSSSYYASCYLTNGASQVGNTCYLTCSQPNCQNYGYTGGVYTGTFDLTGVPPNQPYNLNVYATSTSGASWQQVVVFYYYENAPWIPPKPSVTPQYVFTQYTLTTATTDPEKDNIFYTYNFGDSSTWTSGWVASGTAVSPPSHMWTVPGIYTITIAAKDTASLVSQLQYGITIGQNDAGQAVDAPSYPSSLTVGANAGFYGTLYTSTNPQDLNDCYNFNVDKAGKEIIASIGQVSNTNFKTVLKLYDPTGTCVQTSLPDNYPYVDWVASLAGTYKLSIIENTGEGQYYCSMATGYFGECPVLFYYDGHEYRCQGLLDIHNPNGTDVVTTKTLRGMPERVQGDYLFRLTEDVQTISSIDQVKLFAVLENGKTVQLPLVYAWHSQDGNVLRQLLFADGWRTTELGANHNNGVSQSIQLKFGALPPNVNAREFIFEIKGCNRIVKV